MELLLYNILILLTGYPHLFSITTNKYFRVKLTYSMGLSVIWAVSIFAASNSYN
jgi:hypothetical protein